MKKITFYLTVLTLLAFSWQGKTQVLNQGAAWPNAAWTVTGTFNADPTAFEADPTLTANFAFDDDDAGSGSDDDIAAESPVIDLTAAFAAGETWITMSGDYVYNRNTGDILQFEYWDADAGTWNIIGAAFPSDTAGAPNDLFCGAVAEPYTTDVLDIAAFTATQLSGFRYRIFFDDTVGGGGWEWGFCFQSPTIVSATPPSCADPTVLTATSIDASSAVLGWTENGAAVLWNIELVDITAGGTVTGTATATGVTNPYSQTGLASSNDYQFYVQADCGGAGTSAWVGPFAFTTPVSCPDPTAQNVTNITTTTADFGWTAGASELLWDIELVDVTAAGTATGTPTATGVANPYMQTGLTVDNSYQFYVRADCAAGGTSNWVGPFDFNSACNAFIAPYTEGFENAGAIPACWFMSGGEDWFFNTAGPNHVGSNGTITGSTTTGSYYAGVDASNADPAAVLLSPFVDVTGLTVPALSFFEISDNEGNANSQLLVEVWDGAAWNTVGTYTSNTSGWEQKVIDLSGLTITGDVQARFTFSEPTPGDFYDDIAIDDVTIDEMPTCIDPSTIAVANLLETSADLSWTENGTATAWNVELVDVTAGGTATGTPTASTAATSYSAAGLTGDNSYEFYVQADCAAGGLSAWVGPFTFTTPYVAVAPDCTNGTFLDTGGASGDYSTGENTTFTICPTNAGEAVTVTFTAFSTENNGAASCYDGLTIHDGPDNTAITIDPPAGGAVWCWDRDDAVPTGTGDLQGMAITSSDASGCLTFVFTSDGSVNREGWEATVSCAVVGLDDFSSENFTYYPNPVNNNILVLNSQNTIQNISVSNMVGQNVLEISPNSTTHVLQMDNLKSGLYFVKVKVDGGAEKTFKIIKK
jgi:hypothetical protein